MVTVPANESELAASKHRTLSDEPSELVILLSSFNLMAGLPSVSCFLYAKGVESSTRYIKLVLPNRGVSR
jgi:hypothetical protein